MWATWCVPCQVELPHLKDLQARMKDSGVVFLTINLDENTALVGPYLAKSPLTMPVLYALDWAKKASLDHGIPRNLVIDGSGVLRAEEAGFSLDTEAWLTGAQRTIEAMQKAH